jgi:hypothetical protein
MSNAKRYNRGTDWSKITDHKLSEILANPHTQGTDGVDYAPYLEELLSEQYRRYEARSLEALKRWEILLKQEQKHLTSKKLA